jgi:hypothetical protein
MFYFSLFFYILVWNMFYFSLFFYIFGKWCADWWFGTFFSIDWECHHPKWRTHIFRGGSTTKSPAFLAQGFRGQTHQVRCISGEESVFLMGDQGIQWFLVIFLWNHGRNATWTYTAK